jgi:hypothetical protein
MPDADPGLMTLFAEALERTDPADRAAYLDGASAGDAALRRRVEALLAAHDGAGRFLEPDATGMSGPASDATLEVTRKSAPETRPPPEPATREDTPDGTIAAVAVAVAPPAAPPTGSSRARSSPAVTRCSKSSARAGWARSTGPSRPDRSSGGWP